MKERFGERKDSFETTSGIPIETIYTERTKLNSSQQNEEFPGEYPFTRGVQPNMYRGRFWTMRQYAGLASPEESNRRYRYLLDQGQTGLSVAFDLPTQTGYDSDHQMASGEIGRTGVPISSLADMEILVSQNDDGSWETKAANSPMTVRQLMSHTGGLLYTPPLSQGPIANAYSEAGIMDLYGTTLEDSIPALKDIPLAYEPGTQWIYSISVDVQGYMVEKLSGQKFDEFLQERIFEPLGMEDTAFYVKADKADRFARQYFPTQDGSLNRTDTGAFLNPCLLYTSPSPRDS